MTIVSILYIKGHHTPDEVAAMTGTTVDQVDPRLMFCYIIV